MSETQMIEQVMWSCKECQNWAHDPKEVDHLDCANPGAGLVQTTAPAALTGDVTPCDDPDCKTCLPGPN